MAAFSNSRPTQAAASVTAPWDPRPGIRGDGQAAAGDGMEAAQRQLVQCRRRAVSRRQRAVCGHCRSHPGTSARQQRIGLANHQASDRIRPASDPLPLPLVKKNGKDLVKTLAI